MRKHLTTDAERQPESLADRIKQLEQQQMQRRKRAATDKTRGRKSRLT